MWHSFGRSVRFKRYEVASCGLSTYVLLAAMATSDKALKRQKVDGPLRDEA